VNIERCLRYAFATVCLFVMVCRLPGAQPQSAQKSGVLVLDPAVEQLISPDAKLEPVKVNFFGRMEGPVWVPGPGMSGYLLFPEVAGNIVYKWQPTCAKYPCGEKGELSTYLRNVAFTGTPDQFNDVGFITYNGQIYVVHIGPVGLALDRQLRLIVTAFGDHEMVSYGDNKQRTVLASTWNGLRLNCPDDAVATTDGTIYWTDGPQTCYRQKNPFGFDGPNQQIKFPALYMIKNGVNSVLDKTNPGVNGVALSPDQKILYVTGPHDTLLKYDVQPDGTVTNRVLFIDMLASAHISQVQRDTADAIFPDGVRVDSKGDIWTPGPGGIWIISPEGKHLGTILPPPDPELLKYQVFCSLAFGDDGKTLYIDGNTSLWQIRLKVCGSSVPPFTCNDGKNYPLSH
jgi:gluconolactonase